MMRRTMFLTMALGALALGSAGAVTPTPRPAQETIVFSGGCFWGVQSVFEHTKGVLSAVSGYAGGSVANPSYELVSSGATGHAESVRVTYDPSQVSLDQLLRIFFTVAHDPTQLNRQGPDVGTQYRSQILYMNEDQHRTVQAFIDSLTQSHKFAKPIVTQVVAYKSFYPAEEYHQHYAERHPTEPYIAMFDLPKVENLRKEYPTLYREMK
jgi:peptide-methionine (S)-S-oxide reductase